MTTVEPFDLLLSGFILFTFFSIARFDAGASVLFSVLFAVTIFGGFVWSGLFWP